ncbi:MAG TPA: sialidase family protein [Blastocatellia bacterium]|nr:sialidase family protein [Blastocatellia bacterium]
MRTCKSRREAILLLLALAVGGAFAADFRYAVFASSPSSNAAAKKLSGTKWKADVRLTFDPGASRLSYNFARCLAADGSSVHAVWYDNREGTSQIYYKHSSTNGATWTPEVRLSEGAGEEQSPAVASAGSRIYAVWHAMRHGGSDIFFKRSSDRGETWGPVTPLTTSGGGAFASIAIDGMRVHVVWADNRDAGQAEVYTRYSTDGGETWSLETRLSDLQFDSWVPTVAVSDGTVIAAWVDTRDGNEEEYMRRSTDGGSAWGPITRITNNAANSWAPSVAIDGQNVHFVWFDQQDSPYQPLEVEKKLDTLLAMLGLPVEAAPTGVVVPDPEAAARHRAGEKAQQIEAAAPAWIAAGGDSSQLQAILQQVRDLGDGGASYLVKERKLDEAMRLMNLTYAPGPPVNLPRAYYLDAMFVRVRDKIEQIQAQAPNWVHRGGDPKVIQSALIDFEQSMKLATTEWEIYYKQSTDGGLTWSPSLRLTNLAGPSQRPSIAVRGRELYVVWFDGQSAGESEVYYDYSPDAGTTWEPPVRLTDHAGDSIQPVVAVGKKFVHVLWFDSRDGNYEIYYKAGKRKNQKTVFNN